MCRWMKRRLIIWSRATAKPNKVIFGRAAVPVAMCFSVGKPAAPPRAWTTSFPPPSRAPSSVTATRRIAPLPIGRGQTIELAGCWAHVRRKFHEALESSPRLAGWFLRQIQHLYRIEARLREHQAGPRLRAAVRASQSRPIVKRIERALIKLKASKRHLPQSLLGIAIDYALGQWRTLDVYLGDGRVEIDNNLVENAIRPTAIGKKNWLFIGEADAGQRSAIIYTVIESCRRRGLDPYAYLRDVLTRLPNMTNHQIPEVIPAAWAKTQRTPQLQAAS